VQRTYSGDSYTRSVSSASANLATGVLKGDSFVGKLSGTTNRGSAGAVANARIQEGVTILGDFTTPITVLLTMSVDGWFRHSDVVEFQHSMYGDLTVSGFASARGGWSWRTLDNGGLISEIENDQPGGTAQFQEELEFQRAFLRGLYSVEFEVRGLNPYFFVDASLQTSSFVTHDSPAVLGGGSVESDFGNTAYLDLKLPAGVEYTSDSGVFLTERDSINQVPLPGTLGLLGLGLAGLCGSRYKKQG
jgi:hypothetical protein